jgi:lipid-A-disaccharide synthase
MLAAARSVAAGLAAGGQAKPRIVVAAAPSMDDSVYAPFLQGEELTRDTLQLLRRARAAVVNSGTATLETALLGCPQTAVYHVTGSKVLGFLRRLIFSTPFFTLVNIIAGREVIQELVGPRFSRRNIEDELMRLLADNDYRRTMSAGYASVRTALETRDTVRSTAAAYAAECILGKNKV